MSTTARARRCSSRSVVEPLCRCRSGTELSAAGTRVVTSSLSSNEHSHTGRRCCRATWRQTSVSRVERPIAGREAMTVSVPGARPPVSRSNSASPVRGQGCPSRCAATNRSTRRVGPAPSTAGWCRSSSSPMSPHSGAATVDPHGRFGGISTGSVAGSGPAWSLMAPRSVLRVQRVRRSPGHVATRPAPGVRPPAVPPPRRAPTTRRPTAPERRSRQPPCDCTAHGGGRQAAGAGPGRAESRGPSGTRRRTARGRPRPHQGMASTDVGDVCGTASRRPEHQRGTRSTPSCRRKARLSYWTHSSASLPSSR